MRVLIADDEATSRRLIQATLWSWGFEVLVAGDGCEALRVLQEPTGPEIAMLDWIMPGIDGLEVCRRVRASMPNAATYIILLTARGGLENVVRGTRGRG